MKRVRRDDGVIVLTALLLPFAILLVSLSVDIGNWWVHKRHLQLQADAAALAGGALMGQCFSDPSGGQHDIQAEATKYNGGPTRSTTGRSATRTRDDQRPLPEQDVRGGVPCGGRHRDAGAVRHAELMFDVKATEANLPLLFDIPGLDFVPSISAHARVQLKTVIQQDGILPVAVPTCASTTRSRRS